VTDLAIYRQLHISICIAKTRRVRDSLHYINTGGNVPVVEYVVEGSRREITGSIPVTALGKLWNPRRFWPASSNGYLMHRFQEGAILCNTALPTVVKELPEQAYAWISD
jgi:hypothetical protein